jgi:hypothetical protein
MGDIFLKNAAFIKLYKYYVNNYGQALVTLKECKTKHPQFRDYLA